MQEISLPKYIARGGDQTPPQPYSIRNATLYFFVLEANIDSIKSLLEKDLNSISERKQLYSPLGPFLLLVFSIQRQISGVSPLGWMSGIEAGFWIPVSTHNPFRIRFYQPYIFSSDGYFFTAGREIYGMNKIPARCQIPSLNVPTDIFTVETIVSRGKDKQEIWDRVLELDCVLTLEKPTSIWQSMEQMGEEIHSLLFGKDAKILLPGLPSTVNFLEHLIHLDFGFVSLKQFRDLEHSDRACYQAIVEAMARAETVRSGGFLPHTYELQLHSFANFPLSQDLGLKEGSNPVRSSFWLDFDYEMEIGKEIFKK